LGIENAVRSVRCEIGSVTHGTREKIIRSLSTATAAWGEAFYADESHQSHLHQRDQEENQEQNPNPFPAAAETA
jgi:hypothetical protein